MAHPLEADIETISSALAAGLTDELSDAPDFLKLNYESPLSDGAEGVATLRFADWRSENQGVLYVPMVVDPDNTVWQAYCENGLAPVSARLMVRDILGRAFKFTANGQEKMTGYLQFDVLQNGVVFSAQPPGEDIVTTYGGFEGKMYDMLSAYAKRVGSFSAILDLASRY